MVLDPSDALAEGTEIYIIGHPFGLPMKVAGNARVESIDDNYFRASLDAFRGNSGSPVFRADTHAAIGIYVRGERSIEVVGGCYVTLAVEPGTDRKKSCTFIRFIANAMASA